MRPVFGAPEFAGRQACHRRGNAVPAYKRAAAIGDKHIWFAASSVFSRTSPMANEFFSHFGARSLRYGLAAATLVALGAAAQPAGNPKGTVTPPSSDAEKAPATRPPEQARGSMDQG